MRITQFNSLINGGAANAARNLHDSLVQMGVDSEFRYSHKLNAGKPELEPLDASYVAHDFSINSPSKRNWRFGLHRLRYKLNLLNRRHKNDLFTWPTKSRETSFRQDNERLAQTDVLHLHWIAKWVDPVSFFRSIPRGKPVVWTLHDMNPLTGGCHFSGPCDRFTVGCGRCPQFRVPSLDVGTSLALQIKQSSRVDHQIHVVAPSRWLLDQARRSLTFVNAKSFHHIPYSIDADRFRVIDRAQAKQNLGLDPTTKVIAFGAMDVDNPRKGVADLLKSLSSLRDRNDTVLVVFGSGQLPNFAGPLPQIKHMGLVRDPLQMNTIYSAADVFALPSHDDNLPLTGIESLACGTPIAAYAAGGIADYVQPGITGHLAPVGHWDRLARAIETVLYPSTTNPDGKSLTMRQNCRRSFEADYAAPREAQKYLDLYRSIASPSSSTNRVAA